MANRVDMQVNARQVDGMLETLHAVLKRDGYQAALKAARARLAKDPYVLSLPTRRSRYRLSQREAIAYWSRGAVRAARSWAAGDRCGWRDLPGSSQRPIQRWYVGRLNFHDERTLPLFGHGWSAERDKSPSRLP